MGRRGRPSDDRRRALVTGEPRQGEIWWASAADKRRPVLVVTRNEALPVLHSFIVAPVTRTVRHIPTEIPLDADEVTEISFDAASSTLTVRYSSFNDQCQDLPTVTISPDGRTIDVYPAFTAEYCELMEVFFEATAIVPPALADTIAQLVGSGGGGDGDGAGP